MDSRIPTPKTMIPMPMWPCAGGTDCCAHDDMSMTMLFGPRELCYSVGRIVGKQLDEDTFQDVMEVQPGYYCAACCDALDLKTYGAVTLRDALRALIVNRGAAGALELLERLLEDVH